MYAGCYLCFIMSMGEAFVLSRVLLLNAQVLVDPWLIDDLTFGPKELSFLYVGKKGTPNI